MHARVVLMDPRALGNVLLGETDDLAELPDCITRLDVGRCHLVALADAVQCGDAFRGDRSLVDGVDGHQDIVLGRKAKHAGHFRHGGDHGGISLFRCRACQPRESD